MPIHSQAEVIILIRYLRQSVSCDVLGQGCALYCTAGPNAHNQIGPRPTTAYVKLCVFDNALTTHGRFPMPDQPLGH